MYCMRSLINTPKVVSLKFTAILETMPEVEKKRDLKNLGIRCRYQGVLAKRSPKLWRSLNLKIKKIEKNRLKNYF